MIRFSFLVGTLALSAGLVSLASGQNIQINRDNKTIAISTTDEATATADIAAITIGFEILGPDAQTVTANAGKLSHAILDALHKAGIDDKAIESGTQGLERNTNFDDKDTAEERANRQFVFRQSWEVTAAPQLAADTIRAAIAAGANQSGGIEWRLADRKGLQAKAAENALVKARELAAKMADGLHVKLGDLIYASNETPNAKLYFARPLNGKMPQTLSMSAASSLVAPALEIRPQTVREEATVYAVFAIE